MISKGSCDTEDWSNDAEINDILNYNICLLNIFAQCFIYSGYGKYSDPLKFFTLCYIAAIC